MSDEFHHRIGIRICEKHVETLAVTRILLFVMHAYGALLPAGAFAN